MTAIVVTGLDHHTAPVEVRERLAFRDCECGPALQRLRQVGLDEVAILSTCNRVEVYAVGGEPRQVSATVEAFLAQHRATPNRLFASHLYHYDDRAAVRHLCATAAGLESLVLGEAQIQGQVREASVLAQAAGTSGPILGALFRSALVAGKRARSETAIGASAASVSYAGVELVRRCVGDLRAVRILLVGSGKVSELAVKTLLANGARSISLVNRSLERAQALADQWGGQALPFEQLPAALAEADLVISSTAAPQAVIRPEHVRAALTSPRPHPLILIDLAVPRDIDPDVAKLAGVSLYNIDDLEAVVRTTLGRRAAEVDAVRAIVEQEASAFESWLATRMVSSTLETLRAHGDAIRQMELEKALRRLGCLSERQQRIVEAMASGIVNKLLHSPTVRLRDQAAQGNGVEYAEALRQLFGFE